MYIVWSVSVSSTEFGRRDLVRPRRVMDFLTRFSSGGGRECEEAEAKQELMLFAKEREFTHSIHSQIDPMSANQSTTTTNSPPPKNHGSTM